MCKHYNSMYIKPNCYVCLSCSQKLTMRQVWDIIKSYKLKGVNDEREEDEAGEKPGN